MEIKSWVEEYRENRDTGEKLEAEKQEAREYEATWRADNEKLFREDDIMHTYANLLMEKELKELGEYIIKKYPSKKDKWKIATAVYRQYGRYYLFNRQPTEAIIWFQKALKNGEPSPYIIWNDLAAAYAEAGDHEKAHHWIKRYVKHHRAKFGVSRYEWMEFAKYYVQVNDYERAMALILECSPDEKYQWYDAPEVAKAFMGVGNLDKGFQIYEDYLAKYGDDFDYAELALQHYNYDRDFDKIEPYYLKSLELAENRKNKREWYKGVYNNLSIIFANTFQWDKCFHYLELHYQYKYNEFEARIFSEAILNRPPIESNDMGFAIYCAIKDFEKSPLRPGSVEYIEGNAAENPADIVKDSTKNGNDILNTFNWDETSSN